MITCQNCGERVVDNYHICAPGPAQHVIEGPAITPLGPKSTKILEAVAELERGLDGAISRFNSHLDRVEAKVMAIAKTLESLLEAMGQHADDSPGGLNDRLLALERLIGALGVDKPEEDKP